MRIKSVTRLLLLGGTTILVLYFLGACSRTSSTSPGSSSSADAHLAQLPLISFVVTPFQTRGANELQSLVIPPGEHTVLLETYVDRAKYSTYGAALRTAEGQTIWEGTRLAPVATQRGDAVSIKLSSTMLHAGAYILTIHGVTSGGKNEEIEEYAFHVIKQ